MASATLVGKVFNDLNSNGTYDVGEPGIPGAYVVISTATIGGGICLGSVQTDINGNYSFPGITIAGGYNVSETVIDPTGDTCPPSIFTQPNGFNDSTTRRFLPIAVAASDITNSRNVPAWNFGHDNKTPFGCNSYGIQIAQNVLYQIDLVTGLSTTIGNPGFLNGIGYNVKDGNIWQSNASVQRLTPDMQLLTYPVANYPSTGCVIGDVDSNGYLYSCDTFSTSFFVTDVNPNRASFGYMVNPQAGFTISNAGVLLPGGALGIYDWAFNPNDGQLYSIINSSNVIRINPITGAVTTLTTTPTLTGFFGAMFFDTANNIYTVENFTGAIYQYHISGNTATAKVFSQGQPASNNDGARCPYAPLTGMVKSATPYVGVGGTITYTLALPYYASATGTDLLFKDTIPNGTTFVPNSLKFDGNIIPGSPNPPGISLPDLSVGNHTITFDVVVNTVPSTNPLPNQAVLSMNSYANNTTVPLNLLSTKATTTVINSNIVSTKTVTTSITNLGGFFNYNIVLKNVGNTTAYNIVFRDTLPNGTILNGFQFKQDSIFLSGNPNPPGVTLPNPIPGGLSSTIYFQVLVTSIPSPNPMLNSSTAIYSFTITNTTVVKTASSNSNTVSTTLLIADLSRMTKTVDKSFATLNDILTYSFTIPNSGTTTANAVVFKDTIPTGTTFVANSVTVNGVSNPGVSPAPPGINIGAIPANGIFTVTFKVTVNTIPSPNRVTNSANATFNYLNPSTGGTTAGSANSSIVNTTITRTATILPTKIVDSSGAFIGDTLNYTIGLKNTGTTTANNIFFTDTTPNGTIFVPNSVKINGVTQTGAVLDPPSGITIPNLGVNQSATVNFQVTVNTTPSPNPTTNIGTASYSYTDTASGTNGTSVNNTNTASTFIYPNSNPFKLVDNLYATIGTTLTYTLGWVNTVGVQETNVVFVDTIPTGTTFVSNSVTVNGVSKPGATVTGPNGINTGTLAAGGVVSVSFKVTVDTIPTVNPIPNSTTAIYSDTLVVGRQSAISNTVDTQVNYSNLQGGVKAVDKNFVAVGDTLTYTVTIVNIGNSSAENVIFYDTIPTGTSFINGSFTINGVTLSNENPDPSLGGASIGTLPLASVSTIVFQVSVNTIPSPNSIPNTASLIGDYILDPTTGTTISIGASTNTVTSKVNFADLSNPVKGVDKVFSDIPTTLTYTITIVNSGNTSANNVVFVDTVPDGTNLVLNSVTVNGLPITGVSPNPPGVTIGTIPLGATSTVTFKVTVNTIPTTNPIPNTGTVGYDFIVDPTLLTISSGVYNTNTVDTTINHADLGNIMKFTSKQYGQCGDIIIYTISIPNSGNVDALNVVLSDTVPNGTIYVPNSLTVDGNPIGGTPASINVGTVPARNTVVVTFQVKINC